MTSSSDGRKPARDPAARTRASDASQQPPASFAERAALDAARPSRGAGSAYARFIPREEVGSFAAWTPGSFGGTAAAGAAAHAPAAAPAPDPAEQLQAARQAGYQDGYRDGLVALEAFKQSYAQQVTAQMGGIAQAWRAQLEQLEGGLSAQVAEVAIALARQVLRSELALRPELVAGVAQEALAATLVAARQVGVHLHPDDHALVQAHAGETLAARGARLVADAALARGGCVIETEIGVIDASIEARWRRATAAMGRPSEFEGISPLPFGERSGEGPARPALTPTRSQGERE